MERNELLQQLANSINAAVKIKTLGSLLDKERSETAYVRPSEIHIICEMLKTIAAYSPERYKSNINNSIELSNHYFNTYKNLKNHLKSANSRKLNSVEIMQTLKLVKPVLPNRHKSVVEKIQNVYEIITDNKL
jgi:hypothetical protein